MNNKRGFICGDPSISYKFKPNTISTKFVVIYQQLILLGLVRILNFVIENCLTSLKCFQLWLVEFLIANDKNLKSKLLSSGRKALAWFCNYMLVWSLMLIIFSFVKGHAGTNRPHFLDLCKPNKEDCVTGTLVADYDCTNPDLSPFRAIVAARSFPSGHAGCAVYFSVFLMWFLQYRVIKLKFSYLIPTLQCILFGYIMFCGMSRISDNAHHPIDVFFGTVFGLMFSVFAVSLIKFQFSLA